VSGLMMTTETGNHTAKLETRAKAEKIFLGEKEGNRTAVILKVKTDKANEVELTATLKGFGFVNFTLVYEEYLPLRNNSRSQSIRFRSDSIGQTIDGKFSVSLDADRGEELKSIELLDELAGANSQYWLGRRGPQTGAIHFSKIKGAVKVEAKPTRLLNATDIDGRSYHDITMVYHFDQSIEEHIVLSDEYFAYYFPTKILVNLTKHIIFVLDVSGSMHGLMLEQTIDTMITILDSLKSGDHFNIITFSTGVNHWPSSQRPALANSRQKDAVTYVRTLVANGGTNINEALLAGLSVAELTREKRLIKENTDLFIFMMTDGVPWGAETRPDVIQSNVKSKNIHRIPIHKIAFGSDADYKLLEAISRDNFGIAFR